MTNTAGEEADFFNLLQCETNVIVYWAFGTGFAMKFFDFCYFNDFLIIIQEVIVLCDLCIIALSYYIGYSGVQINVLLNMEELLGDSSYFLDYIPYEIVEAFILSLYVQEVRFMPNVWFHQLLFFQSASQEDTNCLVIFACF